MARCLVQIYEVQTPREAETLVKIGVDHLGSVLLPDTDKEQPEIKAVVDFAREAGATSSLIPLFRDPDRIAAALDYYQPDIVHFCEALTNHAGDSRSWEQAYRVQRIVKERFPEIKAMRSIPIAPPGQSQRVPSLTLARHFEAISDYFLTDTLLVNSDSPLDDPQPVNGFVGITGQLCDWDVAAQLVAMTRIPVILAGGISPENVADGIRCVAPAGVDSCTGTNAVDADGQPIRFQKDPDKVRKLVNTVRGVAA